MKLSLCMIVQNEETYLPRCLDSVRDLVDEIIIVDGGSTDKTKDIARRSTDKVFAFPWCDNFSTSRNFSLSKATSDWILVLDADETLSQGNHAAIRKLLTAPRDVVAYSFTQMSYTNDLHQLGYHPLPAHTPESKDFSGYLQCTRIILFRNHPGIRYAGAVHESVRASCEKVGKIVHTPLLVHHYQFEKGMEVQRAKQLHYLRIYEKNIDTFPNKIRAYCDMASILFSFTKDYATALSYFQKALALTQRNLTVYIGMGLCYYHLHEYQKASQIFTQGLHFFPGNSHLLSLRESCRHHL